MSIKDYEIFKNLTFDKFKEMAADPALSKYQKIGFPDSYRTGYEEQIFSDIKTKLKNLLNKNQVILDIGPGCSDLPRMLIELCRQNNHTLILIDSKEMLEQLPEESFIIKIPARYPDCRELFQNYSNKINVILCYSVLHYIFAEGNIFDFIDKSLLLLAPLGEMLLGDIPNVSKRKRFFSSDNGIKFHQQFTQTNEIPSVKFNNIESEQIDDAVVLGIISRCRNFGLDAYLLPQNEQLSMANRREDILIIKP
jgi:hypothetical protein